MSEDGWYYRVWRGETGRYVAECKRTPFNGRAGHYASTVQEIGDIFFEIGATEEEALAKLKTSNREAAAT